MLRSIGNVRPKTPGRAPTRRQSGSQRRRGPGVHHVRIGNEAAGLTSLGLAEASWHVRTRIDRQAVFARQDGVVVVRLAFRSPGYQTGNGTPKNRCREISQSPFRPLTQLS